ncbi:hypothetical protein [Streptomyces sp. G-G2]|uniref:hypothetical protein n=1 Tax=Streptomyces sp. G-G2 TaxID=3046201 RepID=UPI0024BA05C1|nr:hypothetical protein [Streptomyces sp. G-G2]MDJ0385317.1 hypothetical protein [Streptomyces sp. G-G2]
MRARIAFTAAAAVLAVGSAAAVTIANASASEDTGLAMPASSATGQPGTAAPTLTGTPSSTATPEPGSTTTPPAEPGSTTTPPTPPAPPAPSKTSGPSQTPAPSTTAKLPPHDYHGKAAYYDVGRGACGKVSRPSDFVVALNSAMFGSGFPSPTCGKKVKITYKGKSITATVLDESPGAAGQGLELSKGAFEALSPQSEDPINVTWRFTN